MGSVPVIGSMAEHRLFFILLSTYPLPLSLLVSLTISSHFPAFSLECQSKALALEKSDPFPLLLLQDTEEVSFVPSVVNLACCLC